MKTTGTIFFILGLVLTVFTSCNFFTKEKAADQTTLGITRNMPHYLSWSPIIGIVVMGIGGVVLSKASAK